MMAKGTARYERMVAERKRALFAGDLGAVAEIGAGTGPNLRYLGKARSYQAFEPNPYMHPFLEAEMERCGVRGLVDAAPAEVGLDRLEANCLDAVVSTLVLCSVRDQARLLEKIHRVLRPGGRLLLLEHVGAGRGTARCACQHLLLPAFHFLADGCHPTRDTARALRARPFREVSIEEFELPLGPISPHICGWAEK
jgi:SAM-dependent methyltransferase